MKDPCLVFLQSIKGGTGKQPTASEGESQWVPLKGTGVITACTVQYFTTSAFIRKLPFICAYVKLDGTDFIMMTNMEVEDVSGIKVGTRVKAHFREERHGAITDVYFRPVD